MIKIVPSILASDFTRLGEEVLTMEAAGVDGLHLDVMDGHFVRNISFGTPIISSLRKVTDLFFDTHLMIQHPLFYVEEFVQAGSDRVTFHVEASDDPDQVIERIHKLGVEAGLSLSPYTPIEKLYPYLEKIQQVLVMTVEPGRGGQAFMEHVRTKIETLDDYRTAHQLSFEIEVDGGINKETAPQVTCRGGDILVAGSALFSQEDYTIAVAELRKAGEEGAKRLCP